MTAAFSLVQHYLCQYFTLCTDIISTKFGLLQYQVVYCLEFLRLPRLAYVVTLYDCLYDHCLTYHAFYRDPGYLVRDRTSVLEPLLFQELLCSGPVGRLHDQHALDAALGVI